MRNALPAAIIILALVISCGPTPTPEPTASSPAEAVPTVVVLQSPVATTAPTLAAVSTARPSPTPRPTSSPRPSPSPTSMPLPTTSPSPLPSPSITPSPLPGVSGLALPLVVDSEGGRLYLRARVEDEPQILALSAADGSLQATYQADGPFGLDPANGWLYVDRGDEGLVVLDVESGAVQATIPLPKATLAGHPPPAPCTHPSARQGLAFRDNVVYLIDPVQGQISHSFPTSVKLYNSDVLPIAGAIYDPDWALLYLLYSYSPAPRYNYTVLVSFDMTSESEVARQQFAQTDASDLEAVTAGGRLSGQSGHWFAGPEGSASFWSWQEGLPHFSSDGWTGAVARGLQIDVPRQRLYATTDEGLLVLDAGTLALSMVVPRPAPGRLSGYDPGTDQLYFLTEQGTLHIQSAQAIQPPVPRSPAQALPPAQPVRALVASGSDGGATLSGIWQASAQPEDAMILGRSGGPLYLGEAADGVGTWKQALGGLPGDARRLSAVAISPGYARDGTLLSAVVGLGVFRSTDRGRLWQPASAGLENMGVDELLLSPAFDLDGTAFAQARYQPLHRSRDGGQSWQALSQETCCLALSPEFGQDGTLLAAAGTFACRELHLSRDGGDTWEQVGEGANQSPLTTLSLAPLFAKWQVAFGYEQEGRLYRSADGGRSWTRVLETGLSPSGAQVLYAPDIETNRPVFLLAVPRYDPTYNTATGYVPPEPPDPGGRLYRSGDGGLTWQIVQLPAGVSPTVMTISPRYSQDHVLYVGTADGRVLSLDTGTLP